TLVLYMGLAKLGTVAEQLMKFGKPAKTRLALVERGTTSRQRVVEWTLADAAANGRPPELASPVLVVIGDVVSVRQRLKWFEDRPLFGRRVLILRPPHQTGDLERRLEELGAQTVRHPVFDILPPADVAPLDQLIGRLAEVDWVVFTSANGVDGFIKRLELQGDARKLGGVQLAAIGRATADALQRYRLSADAVGEESSSEGLAATLASRVAGKRVALVRADRGRDVLEPALRNAGAEVESVTAYRQSDRTTAPAGLAASIDAGELDWVLFTSGNMVRGFFRWFEGGEHTLGLQRLRFAAISPLTVAVVREYGQDVSATAAVPTIEGVVAAVGSF
ncbi:MAG: uroporphyrinogen-III synthase, partial [Planctomycetia bacterium]